MVEIYSKNLVRAIGKVLCMIFFLNISFLNIFRNNPGLPNVTDV